MSRYKTFDATGLATAGRLYAGDLNAIQDQLADLYNLAQTLGVSNVALGEAGLQLLRYGAGEARLSGHMRVDGILRGLSGLFAGAFSTSARDAIPTGQRPFTLLIFNTTTSRFEYNAGTDASPNWQPLFDTTAGVPIGTIVDWPWSNTSIPSNYVLLYGQALLRSAFPALNSLASAAGYPHGNGDGSTTFNVPDLRGRVSIGKDDMGGTAASRVTTGGSGINGTSLGASGGEQNHLLSTAEMPAHNHGITGAPSMTGSISNGTLGVGVGSLSLPSHTHSGTTGNDNTDHSHTGTTGGRSAAHTHADSGHAHGFSVYDEDAFSSGQPYPKSGDNPTLTLGASTGTGYANLGTESSDHTHSFGTGGRSAFHQHAFGTGNPDQGAVGIGGAPSMSGSVSNGTLAVGIGTIGTSNTGGGAVHNNMPPGIIVNKMMRAA